MQLVKTISLASLCLTLALGVASAKTSPVKISSNVQELVQVMDENGKPHLKAVTADEITPGDRILYTTTFSNHGNQASDRIVITNPIPSHTRYLGGTAKGENCVITFSADGGKTWGSAQTLKVKQKDGQLRPAQAADYTHIRWQYRGALQPSETKTISFQTQLL